MREYQFDSESFWLLSIGELHKRKNHKVVFEALHRLNNPKVIYLLVGQGELEEEHKNIVRSYGLEVNVRFLGFRNDISILCSIADCFVHPSIREGFGIAQMEAMVARLPLIVSNVNE